MADLTGHLDTRGQRLELGNHPGERLANAFVQPHHLVVDAPIRLGSAEADSRHGDPAGNDLPVKPRKLVPRHTAGRLTLIGGRFEDAVLEG